MKINSSSDVINLKISQPNDERKISEIKTSFQHFWKKITENFKETNIFQALISEVKVYSLFDRANKNNNCQTEKIVLENKEVHLLAVKDKSMQVDGYYWSGDIYPEKEDPRYLGKGAFSVVQAVEQIVSEEVYALKTAKPTEKAVGELHNELFMLELMSNSGKDLRIKEIPRQVGYFDELKEGFYSITKKYEKFDFLPQINQENRIWLLKEFHQLLHTLEDLRKSDFFIRDIKKDNILLDGNKLIFSDLGASGDFREWRFESAKDAIGSFSVQHAFYEDIEALLEAFQKNKEAFTCILEKKEVFNIGLIMFEFFCNGEKPFGVHPDNHYLVSNPIPAELYSSLEAFLGDDLAGFIASMLSEDLEERPTFCEAIKTLGERIQEIEEDPDSFPIPEKQSLPIMPLNDIEHYE